MKKETTRNKILLAANDILRKFGYENFTLAKIAQRAQVSKGGLLYHFPNKQSIIEGMLGYELSKYEAEINNILERQNRMEAMKFIVDYITTIFAEINSKQKYGVIAATASNSNIVNRLICHERKLLQIIQLANPNFENLLIIKLAAEGIWFNYLMGIKYFDKDELKLVESFIMRLLRN